MILGFSETEYQMLCEVADKEGTKPAILARQWVMERCAIELPALSRDMGRVGEKGRVGTTRPDPEPRPDPSSLT